MNKKLFLGMFAAATMLFATSCQNDELDAVQSGKESVVSFTLEQPGIATRAEYSDGTKATTLTYAVYETGVTPIKPIIVSKDEVSFSGKTATVNLRLVTGKTYDILFWADSYTEETNAPYIFNENTQEITVTYTGITSQDENRDAFFAAKQSLKVDGAINETIALYRPFAQLNIATTDHTEEAVTDFGPSQTKVEVSNVYNTLNLLTGIATGEVKNLEYGFAAIPEGETFPVEGVTAQYLSMNYLLVQDEKELVTIDFTVANASGTELPVKNYVDVPVQRNYRTNIYGKLLTDPTDFNITINPDYETPDYEVNVWDGKTTSTPVADANGVFQITSAAELMFVMNSTGTSWGNFYTKEFILMTDIDLNGRTITGFGNEGSAFAGKFDGNGHTISNYYIDRQGKDYYAGLFNYCGINGEAYVKNLTVKKATVLGDNQVGAIVGGANDGFVVDNCKAIACTVSGFEQVGGVVGYQVGGKVINCYAEDCLISYNEAAEYQDENCQVLGFDNTLGGQTPTGEGNTYKNVTIVKNAAPAGTPEDLKNALSKLSTEGTVVLTKDIDLSGSEWDVTMPWSASGTTVTIDGQNHTIKGLNTNGEKGGLLGELSTNGNVVIKNLKIESATLTGQAGDVEDAGGALIGWYENHGGKVIIENVHVKGVTISNFKYSGGLVGYTSTEGLSIENCSVDGTSVSSINHVGGLVGYLSNAANGSESKIVNCKVSNLSVNSVNSSKGREGAIVGTLQKGCSIDNVELTNVTVMGIAATVEKAVGAINEGTVTNITVK